MSKIVFCAAEAAPFAKVGGLGDVVGSLPKALASQGEDVCVFLPRYGCMEAGDWTLTDTGMNLTVNLAGTDYPVKIWETTLPKSPDNKNPENNVPVYMVDSLPFTNPPDIYPNDELGLEVTRYGILAHAMFAALKVLGFQPDVVHGHDWHTSNVAVFLKQTYGNDPFFARTKSVLSIHNMAYQGIYDGVNWLQEGILAADALVAVSPHYARQIQQEPDGAGLGTVLAGCRDKLHGILNGIDTDLLNPETDRFIAKNYTFETVMDGKAACKAALQHAMGLPVNPNVPLLGMVGRLVEQKGVDLLLPILETWKALPIQLAILGSGEPRYEEALRNTHAEMPNIRVMNGFNLALGQQIYAGADIFLMPSRFEPCGLSQMIAMRYGTPPLVRATGGLVDTVFDVDHMPERANGFTFTPYLSDELLSTIKRAVAYWRSHRQNGWNQLIQRGMAADWSWNKSAQAYRQVYQSVISRQTAGFALHG